jgi:exopolyphosphatase/pppGpp-phosphohydrolase
MRLNGAAALADALFDRLQDLHGLAPAWRQRLAAAAILRDAGKAVSRVHSERHSAYVALHADIPFLEPWEKEFVSQLCLWHKRGKVEPEEVPFWKDKVRRTAFLKLLAILRLVEALDHGRSRPVLTGVRRVGRRLSLALKGVAELELLRLDQKKDLFEKTFRVSLSARPA